MWIVSCKDAGFFLVPETKAVSNGILLFTSVVVRKLNSNRESCSLFKIFLYNVPESKVEICESNKVVISLFYQCNIVCRVVGWRVVAELLTALIKINYNISRASSIIAAKTRLSPISDGTLSAIATPEKENTITIDNNTAKIFFNNLFILEPPLLSTLLILLISVRILLNYRTNFIISRASATATAKTRLSPISDGTLSAIATPEKENTITIDNNTAKIFFNNLFILEPPLLFTLLTFLISVRILLTYMPNGIIPLR